MMILILLTPSLNLALIFFGCIFPTLSLWQLLSHYSMNGLYKLMLTLIDKCEPVVAFVRGYNFFFDG